MGSESEPVSYLGEGCGSEKTGETHGEAVQVLEPASFRKFMFSNELKLLIIQAVRIHNAHTEPHGKKDEIFSQVRTIIISNAPDCAWRYIQHTDFTTLREKFRYLI